MNTTGTSTWCEAFLGAVGYGGWASQCFACHSRASWGASCRNNQSARPWSRAPWALEAVDVASRSRLPCHVGLLRRHHGSVTTNTTPATLSCSCAPTPTSRLCCWLGSPTWISSWLPWCAGSPWTSSPSPNRITFGRPRIAESRSWACTLAMSLRCSSSPQPSGRVDVHAHWLPC